MPLKLEIHLVIALIVFFGAGNFAVSRGQEAVLINADIVEMVKAGLSEGIIAAKINSSRSNFDTSSGALIKLKEGNVPENIILAMVNAKPRNDRAGVSESSITRFSLKDAIGKRKVFISCEHQKSITAITKILQKNGFEKVDKQEDAELVITFDYQVHTTTIRTSISNVLGDIGNHNKDQKWGRLQVVLRADSGNGVVFTRENQARDGVIVKFIQKQAEDFTEDFVEELKRIEGISTN